MVTVQHLDVGEEMMGKRYRLSPLKMSVTRKKHVLIGMSEMDQG
jgi:hypothetical protein